MNNNKNKIIIISGPTAVGKSTISIELAKQLNGEIISIDSMQVYKGMDIGTAKVTKEEMQGINHYMIDEIDVNENYNIKEFKTKTNEYINKILDKGKVPILVGGTGFYVNAILYDTDFKVEDEIAKNNIQKELYEQLDKYGNNYLHEQLQKVDEESAQIIDKNNTKRVIRALTYYKLHNKKISEHNKEEQLKSPKFNALWLFINDDRQNLYNNIDKRVEIMIKKGLINEICQLIINHADKNSNAMNAIAYKELYDYCKNLVNNNRLSTTYEDLKDDLTLKELIDKIKQHSRNYAKRQITWYKNKTLAKEIRVDEYNHDYKKILEKIIFEFKNL